MAGRLEGYSGADIKYLADRSATIPFLESVTSGQPGRITADILDKVITATAPSVTRRTVDQFEQWRAELR